MAKQDRTLEDINKNMNDKIADADSIEFGDPSLKDVTLKVGRNFYKLSLVGQEDVYSFKSEIENELRVKLKEKLKDLKAFIDKNMTEAFSIVNTVKSEFNRKEAILTDRLAKAHPMPEITQNQAERGLSVIPWEGGIGWIVRRTYWPKFADRKPINTKTQKKLITNILVLIRTEKEQVTSISLRRLSDFALFDHYHRNCWGDWNWQHKKVKSADDAILIADEAMGVLENINSMSIADRTPYNLPTISTVMRNLDYVAPRARRPRTVEPRAPISTWETRIEEPVYTRAPEPGPVRRAGRRLEVVLPTDTWDTGIR